MTAWPIARVSSSTAESSDPGLALYSSVTASMRGPCRGNEGVARQGASSIERDNGATGSCPLRSLDGGGQLRPRSTCGRRGGDRQQLVARGSAAAPEEHTYPEEEPDAKERTWPKECAGLRREARVRC